MFKLNASFVFLLLLALSACDTAKPPEKKLRPVLTFLVGEFADAVSDLRFSGEVRSRVEQVLAFRVAGKVTARLVDAGSVVKAGQVLARLDPGDSLLSVQVADAQRVLADAEVKRFRELRAKNFVSQSALENRETALQSAEAQVALAKNQSAYTVLRADQSAVVGQVLVEAGQVVAAGQGVFKLVRPDVLEVAIAIPETRLADVRKAGEAEIRLWTGTQRVYRGRLREIAAIVDPVTRTYAARVSILDADAHIFFGMTANVRFLSVGQDDRPVIPLSALFQHEGGAAVWVVGQEGVLALRPVIVDQYTSSFAVLQGGLSAGERVVRAGVHQLSVGERVRIVKTDEADKVELPKRVVP